MADPEPWQRREVIVRNNLHRTVVGWKPDIAAETDPSPWLRASIKLNSLFAIRNVVEVRKDVFARIIGLRIQITQIDHPHTTRSAKPDMPDIVVQKLVDAIASKSLIGCKVHQPSVVVAI